MPCIAMEIHRPTDCSKCVFDRPLQPVTRSLWHLEYYIYELFIYAYTRNRTDIVLRWTYQSPVLASINIRGAEKEIHLKIQQNPSALGRLPFLAAVSLFQSANWRLLYAGEISCCIFLGSRRCFEIALHLFQRCAISLIEFALIYFVGRWIYE